MAGSAIAAYSVAMKSDDTPNSIVRFMTVASQEQKMGLILLYPK